MSDNKYPDKSPVPSDLRKLNRDPQRKAAVKLAIEVFVKGMHKP